jgi:DNA polymerase
MSYNYCGAHTTRFSGGNKMNVQNLERGGTLRKAIKAPADHVIVAVDSAQIEARLNAWVWDEEEVLTAFRDGKDVYKMQASQTYGVPMSVINAEQRFVGKVQILGLGYGMGAKKFRNVLALGLMGPAMDIEPNQAYDWVNAYRRANSKIVTGWEQLNLILYRMAHNGNGQHKCFGWETHNGDPSVWLPSGLPMVYKNLYATEDGSGKAPQMRYQSGRNGKFSSIWGGGFDENWVQALARCVVTDQMLLVMDAGWRVVGMTHDEIIAVCHKSQADRCLDEMIAAMRYVPRYVAGAPLNAEGEYAHSYS